MARGRIDRDAVLAAVDLEELADRLVGPHKQMGSAKKWPSPVRGHEQTGRTPPMSIFVDRSGVQRWTCFATGRSGTAIDLVMEVNGWDFRESLYWVADIAGMEAELPQSAAPARREPRPVLTGEERAEGLAALREWHAGCVQWLHRQTGEVGRRWLTERCYGWEDLEALQVGFDPGHRMLPRPTGLPRQYPAVVFPAFDLHGEIVFAQSRALGSRAFGKYFNPAAALGKAAQVALDNPGVGWCPATEGLEDGPVVVCEGLSDMVAARRGGFECAGVLGTGNALRAQVAEAVADRCGSERAVVVCFDSDPNRAGQKAAAELVKALRERDCAATALTVPGGDLTDWLRDAGGLRFEEALEEMVHGMARLAFAEMELPDTASIGIG